MMTFFQPAQMAGMQVAMQQQAGQSENKNFWDTKVGSTLEGLGGAALDAANNAIAGQSGGTGAARPPDPEPESDPWKTGAYVAGGLLVLTSIGLGVLALKR